MPKHLLAILSLLLVYALLGTWDYFNIRTAACERVHKQYDFRKDTCQ